VTRRKILDFGCGTGWVLAKASRHRDDVLVGIDYSLADLGEGSRRFPHLSFVRGNGMALPFADGSFDEVIGHVSLPYMNTRAALGEIHRVLVPGGSFFLTVHSLEYVRRRLHNGVGRGRWQDGFFMLYAIGNGFLNHCGFPQVSWFGRKFETIHTAAGIIKTARRTGFSGVHVEHRPGLIFFGVSGYKPDPERPQARRNAGLSLNHLLTA
jgi:SAM-dependent methyltransferase